MLYDKIKKYSESGVYPFHMPGHKRKVIGDLPLNLDITEIAGFDNLHDPRSVIRKVEKKAETLFGAKRAFLLVNGATGGILAAVRAMTKPGDKIIMARNCHKSVYNAVELCGLNPVYIPSAYFFNTDIIREHGSCEVEDLLCENPDAKLVIITSPTYEGVCSYVDDISFICHEYGVKLLVDEAHGAHFPFGDIFPLTAMDCEADVSVVSLHKTLPAPTQTALLLTSNTELEPLLQEQLAVFETSSPSYLLMSGIEQCMDYVNNHSFKEYIAMLKRFYKKTEKLCYLNVLGDKYIRIPPEYTMYDFGKLVITTYDADITGKQLASLLRNKYKIETEMAAANYVIAMTSICDTKQGINALSNALIEIDSTLSFSKIRIKNSPPAIPERRFLPSQRYMYKTKAVPFSEAEGKVCMTYIYAYPPGIPLIVPGEVISKEIIKEVRSMLSHGVEVTSSDKRLPQFITAADL